MAFGVREHDDQKHDGRSQSRIDDMTSRQHDRLARHAAVKLEEGDDRAGEGDGTNGNAQRHLHERLTVDLAHFANPEGMRRIECGGSHQNGGKTDQRVERGNKLRHGRHGDAACNDGTDTATDGNTDDDQDQAAEAWTRQQKRGDDGNRHTDHAVHIALAAGCRMRQAAQCQNEQHARNEIKEGCEINAHNGSASLFFFLVHGEHALGDQEAAKNVDARQNERDETEAGCPARKRKADGQKRTHHDHR